MKTLLVSILFLAATTAHGQQSAGDRDSVARNPTFQLKVKMKALSAANDLLADPNQPPYVIKYAQLIVTEPNGGDWLAALSYACMANPAVNFNSSEGDIQYTINSVFVKYAKAYYRIIE